MTNVITFPKTKQFVPDEEKVVNDEIIQENLLSVKINHITEALLVIIPQVFNNIEIAGFDVIQDGEEASNLNMKDGAMIVESIKSLLCKYYGLYHPFQEICDNVFEPGEDELKIVPSLHIDFKKD